MSSVNVEDGILRGRPYRGLSLLWNKRLFQVARLVQQDDGFLLWLYCAISGNYLLFLMLIFLLNALTAETWATNIYV